MHRPGILAPVALAGALLVCSPAQAGDVSTLDVIGFSPDGKTFAFEEYGIQDGSGFPYANRFYIDVETDRYLEGTPVRVRLDIDGASTDDARNRAHEQAQSIIVDAHLTFHRGNAVASNAVTELNADPLRMVANPRPVFPSIDEPVEFRLEEIPFPAAENCHGLAEPAGFRLWRVRTADGGKTTLVHEDRIIPDSRACPTGYRLARLHTFYPDAGPPIFALVIAVRRLGFEGPDYRYMAVTGRL